MTYGKARKKANIFSCACAASLLVLGLSACADAPLLNALTGEPPPGRLANRAGILRVDSREAIWPNLASVPPRPDNVPVPALREQTQNKLEAQRQTGLSLLQSYNAATVSETGANKSSPRLSP